MSIIDYYNQNLKTKEEFKYVKTFQDLKKSCKISIIFKLWEDEVIHRYKIKQNYMLWYMRYIILFDYNHKIVS